MKRTIYKRIISAILAILLLLCNVPAFRVDAYAAKNKKLTLSAAKQLAVDNSDKMDALESKVSAKEAAYKSAVKSVTLKEKNLRTFRWSPLLSFKFPSKPDEAEAFEFKFKPVQKAAAVTVAKHALADQYFAEYQKVENLFVSIVSSQKKIEFNQQRLDLMEDTLKKNKARWLMGEASEKDIQNMEKAIEKINKNITSESRTLLNNEKSLSKIIGIDVTTGYDFEDPFVAADLPRSALDSLIESTLDNDQTYFNACSDATLAYLALKTNKELIAGEYKSSDYNIISSYVNQALNGEKINKKGFKSAYESFLTAIDRYWQGNKKILFIKFPREWLRGDLDGVRYIEDEPYALYNAALDYVDALNEKKSVETELTTQVEDSFNNVAALRNTYESYVDMVADASEQMKKDTVLNRVGKLTYEEFSSSQDSYETLQQDMQSALSDYSSALYDFDRLTCGAVSDYLSGTGVSMFAVGGGTAYIDEESKNGANYYISLLAEQNIFELHINIPDTMDDLGITHFALIVNGTQIGDKTEITSKIRHLGLDLSDVASAKIRIYQGDKVLCDCDIDPENYSGPLDIVTDYKVTNAESTDMGTYTLESDSQTGLSKLSFSMDAGSKVKYFKLRTQENKYIGGEDFNDISKTFSYVGVLGSDMDSITIEFFDKDNNYICDAIFSSAGNKVKRLKATE